MRDLGGRCLVLVLAGALLTGLSVGAPAASAQEVQRGCDPEHPEHIGPRFTNGPLSKLSSPELTGRVTGKGVTVAVVDSGVDVRNEHFPSGSVLEGTSLVPGYADAQESAVAHGTAVAGIIAARRLHGSNVVGLAPGATILPVRVFVSDNPNDENPGLDPTADRIAEGIEWAADHGADVVNVSMSSLDRLDALDDAVRHATQRGALVVASAGNNPQGEEPAFTQPVWPAASPGALGVTAADSGDRVTDWSTHGPHVDVVAPGQKVDAPYWYAGDCELSGDQDEPITSFATPFVSATAALLMEAHPDESPRQIAYRIMASADRPVQGERDDLRGWGFLRPYEALTMTLDPGRSGPPFPGAKHGPDTGSDRPGTVDAQAGADPLTGVRQQTAWWLMLGAAAVVLMLIVGRGLALAGPRQTRRRRSQSADRRRRSGAVTPADASPTPSPAPDSADVFVEQDPADTDASGVEAAGPGQRDEPSFVHEPGQGVTVRPTTGALPQLSASLTGSVPEYPRGSDAATPVSGAAPAPSASVTGPMPSASTSGAIPMSHTSTTGATAAPDWGAHAASEGREQAWDQRAAAPRPQPVWEQPAATPRHRQGRDRDGSGEHEAAPPPPPPPPSWTYTPKRAKPRDEQPPW